MASDVLSDVLRSLRATGTVYFCDALEPPWHKAFPGEGGASFHQVRRGGCWLVADGIRQYLGPGDFVFLAPGCAHTLTSEDASAGSPHHDTLLLCGHCQFDEALAIPLSRLFPDTSVIRAEQLQAQAWLCALLDTLSAEYMSMKPGTHIVAIKLTALLLV
ncbi:MAG TPA: AraC family transcriptional regulator, partial [Gammaproteobacteria bacterium]|nr:AraC family transcriptional regulator [Gammaproteobacteria bacterium]